MRRLAWLGIGFALACGRSGFEFPEAGTYRVVLNLGGPGGTAAEELSIDVADNGTGSCSTAPGFGLVGAAIGLGLALSRRRSA